MTTPDPAAGLREAIRQRHQQITATKRQIAAGSPSEGWCRFDHQDWPCDAAALLADPAGLREDYQPERYDQSGRRRDDYQPQRYAEANAAMTEPTMTDDTARGEGLREALVRELDARIRPIEWPLGMADKVRAAIDAALAATEPVLEAYERGRTDGLAEAARWTEVQYVDAVFAARLRENTEAGG